MLTRRSRIPRGCSAIESPEREPLSFVEKLQEASIGAGIAEPAATIGDDEETFQDAALETLVTPASDPRQDPLGSDDRLLDDMLLEQTRREVIEPTHKATEPTIEVVSSTRTIIEAQSSFPQPQPNIPLSLTTVAATITAGISPVEQVTRPTEEVGTSMTITPVITPTIHEARQAGPSAECRIEETSVDIGRRNKFSSNNAYIGFNAC
ncbi:uncharacterized protein LOC109849814 isoform X2 [Asparagus officinalis]|uniref:uncharacterized protein LOC109849814 isoform X2 n=1 Tax=Asparagus officinalis TaxID=4686 RepID=UPI00098E1FCD|nr:uncharacterized protein LOC109849814 isoform X2 [Asparagus officinalis]XP_020275286.1 uncharacterized protein LOC109849814 isoform X2 [Asparagus officinalis]